MGETVTPTAAALLRVLVTDWGTLPAMTLTAHGYGAGTKDFPRANVVRLLLGETSDDAASTSRDPAVARRPAHEHRRHEPRVAASVDRAVAATPARSMRG